MIVRYTRTDSRRRPAAFEQVEIGDGRVLGWRSVAPVVGSFVVDLTPEEQAVADRMAAAVSGVPVPVGHPRPGAPQEVVEVGDRAAVGVAGVEACGDPAWHELTEHLRAWVDRLIEHPYAAVTLTATGRRVLVAHRGAAPIELDLTQIEMRVVVWRADDVVADWAGVVPGPGRVSAGPGWTWAVPLDDQAWAEGDTADVSATVMIAPGGRVIAPSVEINL